MLSRAQDIHTGVPTLVREPLVDSKCSKLPTLVYESTKRLQLP
ncbi:unnamed protein product [Ixodes persulcatus]